MDFILCLYFMYIGGEMIDHIDRDINRWINRKTGVYAGMFVLF